jgi:hypothetical protein
MISADALLANDTDLDGDPLRVIRVRSTDVQYGKITQIDDVNWAYFPTWGANGVTEQIRYIVTDGVTADSNVEGWLSLVIGEACMVFTAPALLTVVCALDIAFDCVCHV